MYISTEAWGIFLYVSIDWGGGGETGRGWRVFKVNLNTVEFKKSFPHSYIISG